MAEVIKTIQRDGVLEWYGGSSGDTLLLKIDGVNSKVTVASTLVVGTATFTQAELAALDGVTAGVVTASKALIVDANKDIGDLRLISLADSGGVNFGAGDDCTIVHDGTTGVDITVADNDSGALVIQEGSNAYLTFDTTDDAEKITAGKKLSVGTHDWGVGATGILLDGNGDNMVSITAGRINAAVASGAYAASYNQLANTITQTNNVSIFAGWDELYLTGGTIVMPANAAARWANLEMSGTSITLSGGIGYHAALVGTVISSATALVIPSGGILAGCHVDSNVATSGFSNSGIFAAFSANTGSGKQNWEHALYINGADSVLAFASGSAYEDGVKITDGDAGDTGSAGKVGFDALMKCYIGATIYYIAMYDADSVTGE